MRPVPPLHALRVFEAAARHLNFRRAADELCVTQAAVSQQIRILEARLGLKLFRRTGRGVSLTSAGRLYLGPIGTAFESISEATRRLTAGYDKQTLTLNVPPTFGIKWLMPRLPAFRERYPWVEVQLVVSIAPVGTLPAEADAAIWHGRGTWQGVDVHRLFRNDGLIPVCSPKLLRGAKPLRRPEDLVRHTLLHAYRELDDWPIWLQHAGVKGIDLTKGPLFDSTSVAVQAAAQGHGIAIGHEPFISEDLREGRVVAPFKIQARSHSTYHLVLRPTKKELPARRAFLEWILEEARPFRSVHGGRRTRTLASADNKQERTEARDGWKSSISSR